MMRNKNPYTRLCERYLEGRTTLQEEQALKEYIAQDNNTEGKSSLLQTLVSLSSPIETFDLIYERMIMTHRRRVKRTVLGLSSCVVVAITFLVVFFPMTNKQRWDRVQTTELVESLCQITELSGGQSGTVRFSSGRKDPEISIQMKNGDKKEYLIEIGPHGGIHYKTK